MIELAVNFIKIIKDPHFYVPLVIILILVMIGYLIKSPVYHKMTFKLLKIGNIEFDLWSLSHVLLYMYFGYYFPDYFIEFLVIGSVWELFESTFCSKLFLRFINCNNIGDNTGDNSSNILCKRIKKIKNCGYWYGKLEDIPLNMIGFVIGAYLSKNIENNFR